MYHDVTRTNKKIFEKCLCVHSVKVNEVQCCSFVFWWRKIKLKVMLFFSCLWRWTSSNTPMKLMERAQRCRPDCWHLRTSPSTPTPASQSSTRLLKTYESVSNTTHCVIRTSRLIQTSVSSTDRAAVSRSGRHDGGGIMGTFFCGCLRRRAETQEIKGEGTERWGWNAHLSNS